jgi:hypothetical protein
MLVHTQEEGGAEFFGSKHCLGIYYYLLHLFFSKSFNIYSLKIHSKNHSLCYTFRVELKISILTCFFLWFFKVKTIYNECQSHMEAHLPKNVVHTKLKMSSFFFPESQRHFVVPFDNIKLYSLLTFIIKWAHIQILRSLWNRPFPPAVLLIFHIIDLIL